MFALRLSVTFIVYSNSTFTYHDYLASMPDPTYNLGVYRLGDPDSLFKFFDTFRQSLLVESELA